MCGILWYITQHPITDDEYNKFSKWLDILKKRGPDNAHIIHNETKNVLLWHTRLSIIDTSSSADQPFTFQKYICIFNGEIYNYQTIKTELIALWHVFITTSDTEVFVHAFAQRGSDCFDKCDGMWACAFYDTENDTITLSRDRLWEKPLYYGIFESSFIFWSELPALLEVVWTQQCTINSLAISNFNTYNFKHIPAPFTPYQEIKKLPPWHSLFLQVSTFRFSTEKYFTIPVVSIEHDPIHQLEKILTQAVVQTCHADVPVGILLSWWVDSSLTTALLKNRNIMTYSLWYDEDDPEIIRARAIATHLWVPNKTIYFKEIIQHFSLFDVIKENIQHLWEPINLFQIFYSDILLREMKKDGIKVVVWWNGADELFYWYNWMNMLKLVSDLYDHIPCIQKLFSPQWIKSYIYDHALYKKKYLSPKFKKFIYRDIFQNICTTSNTKRLIDVFSRLWLTIENEHSVTLIADLSGAKNGMEIRSPYLNKEVIHFAHALPLHRKIRSYTDPKHNKFILKQLLSRYLPEELVYQKKMWFGYALSQSMLLDMLSKDIASYIQLHDIPLHKVGRSSDSNQIDPRNIQSIFEVLLVHIWAFQNNISQNEISMLYSPLYNT